MDTENLDKRFLELGRKLYKSMNEIDARLDIIDERMDSFENLANVLVKEVSTLRTRQIR